MRTTEPRARSIRLTKKFRGDSSIIRSIREAFARAWFKLTHRDMGPVVRYLGPLRPKEQLLWQDPIPAENPLTMTRISRAEGEDPCSGSPYPSWFRPPGRRLDLSVVRQARRRGNWRTHPPLAPQKDWEVKQPAELGRFLAALEAIQMTFNAGGKKISLADLIVLGGSAAIEKAPRTAAMM